MQNYVSVYFQVCPRIIQVGDRVAIQGPDRLGIMSPQVALEMAYELLTIAAQITETATVLDFQKAHAARA